MARPLWNGSISFGLVNVPVRIVSATRDQRLQFHMLNKHDHARVQRKLVSSVTGKEVHPEHIVRGYPVGPNEHVIVQDSELEALAPEESRTIEITDFVDAESIDPIYFDRPYYLLPGERAAKPYRLLVEAMTSANKIGVAKFVMREKEYLATLRPMGDVIALSTMFFADEVLPADEVPGLPDDANVPHKELKMATDLIESQTADFDHSKYHDEHRARVREMIKRKSKGHAIVKEPKSEDEKPHKVINLMAALEQSLNEAKRNARREKVGAGAGHSRHRTDHRGEHRRRKSA